MPSLISSSVVKRIGSEGAVGSAARIASERSRPISGRVSLVVRSQFGKGLVRIDPGQAEQGRDQIGVARRHVELAGAAGQKRAGHDERHMQRLLVGDVPLLVHPVVRALQVAVIRAEDHDRVLVRVARLERVEHPGDLLVDRCLQLVVELQVRLDPRLRRQDRSPQVDHALLTGRFRRQVFLVRRRLLDVRDGRRVVTQSLRQRDDPEHRVVVRVEERADREPRLDRSRRRRGAAATRSSRPP